MRSLRRFLNRVANLATRRAHDERLSEEIQEHLALQTAENLRAGLSPIEARRQAMLKFGGVEAMKQDYRAARGLLLIENLLQDVRYAIRSLHRTSGHLRFTESKLSEIEQEIDKRMRPFEDKVTRLCTIPGVDRVTAWGMLAEIGLNMNQFPSSGHLASWACLCPGSFESAGKRLSGKMRKGNVSLRRCLSQAAWAISMMKNNYLSALYRRIAARRGAKRAVMAVAHALLVIAYHMLKRKEDYRELGADHFDRIDVNRIRRSLVNRLERLGHKVTLEPLTPTA